MELKQLKYLVQIVESGSISKASSILNIAQSALSRQVSALEVEVGVKLLVRTGRGIMPTPAGRMLLDGGAALLSQAAILFTDVTRFRESLAGEVAIGLTPTINRVLAVPIIRRVAPSQPRIKLRLIEGFSGLLLEWLKDCRLDAAVVYQTRKISGISAEQVAEEPLKVIIGSGQLDLPFGSSVDLATLQRFPLILPTFQHGLRQTINEQMQASNLSLNPTFELDSFPATVEMTKNGMGWTILPNISVRDELNSGVLKSYTLVDTPLNRRLVVATGTQRSGSIPLVQIGRLIREEIVTVSSEAGWRLL